MFAGKKRILKVRNGICKVKILFLMLNQWMFIIFFQIKNGLRMVYSILQCKTVYIIYLAKGREFR